MTVVDMGQAVGPIDMSALGADVDDVFRSRSSQFGFTNSDNNDYLIEGTNFTYSGGRPTGGSVNEITIETRPATNVIFPEIVITGLSGVSVARLDDGTRAFWNEVLKGNDTFDLSGLDQDQVGVGRNVIFGDDVASGLSFLPGVVTDAGGNDTITGADNVFDLIGDAFTVAGSASFGPTLFARYNAGDDTIRASTGAVTSFRVTLIGDAAGVNDFGTLLGGNDALDNSLTTNVDSVTAGDVLEQRGGVVNGGNDFITTSTAFSNGGEGGTAGDVFLFRGGTVNGGDDTISVSAVSSFAAVAGDVFSSVSADQRAIFGGDDTITGGFGQDTICGDVFSENFLDDIHGGDDLIRGGAGDDALFGEVRNEGLLFGVTGGDDVISGGGGADVIFGQTGSDLLEGGSGADRIDGGDGQDAADYGTSAAGVAVNLATGATAGGDATGDVLNLIENLLGSTFTDMLTGNAQANVLAGRAGGDRLNGSDGDDTLNGGAAADTLNGGDGADRMLGGGASDRYVAAASDTILDAGGAADELRVANLSDVVSSERVVDDLVLGLANGGEITIEQHFRAANTVETLSDGTRSVVLATGLVGGDLGGIISGTDANEVLDGRGGDDLLFGAGGRDWLIGGRGDDQLHGGAGADTLSGELGADTFVIALEGGMDVVTDFAPGIDTLAFDRESFGFSEEVGLRDVLTIGGRHPESGAALHVTNDGYVQFDEDWSTLAGRETVAQLVDVRASEISFRDVEFFV